MKRLSILLLTIGLFACSEPTYQYYTLDCSDRVVSGYRYDSVNDNDYIYIRSDQLYQYKHDGVIKHVEKTDCASSNITLNHKNEPFTERFK